MLDAAAAIARCWDHIGFVAPCPNGSVLIEYHHRGRALELEVYGEDQYALLLVEGPPGSHRFWERDGITWAEARTIIDLFTSDVLSEGDFS